MPLESLANSQPLTAHRHHSAHTLEEIENLFGGISDSPPRKEKILRNFDFILPNFHFILPNFYFGPPWGIFVFHEAIGDFLGREEIRG